MVCFSEVTSFVAVAVLRTALGLGMNADASLASHTRRLRIEFSNE